MKKAQKEVNHNEASLMLLLKELRLSGFARHHEEVSLKAEREGWSFGRYLYHLVEMEVEQRRQRRIERNLTRSQLAFEKTRSTLEMNRLCNKAKASLRRLCDGQWVGKAENVLVFGLPGRGKTHYVSSVGHELVLKGFTVLFIATFKLVQQLLAAKRDLVLEQLLGRLDRFDVVILDDLGYVQQDRDEMEVLFTFLAERYERKSVMLTSNLVFSQWDRIFKDAMTTAAAIDRLVHHATIVELTGKSYRNDTAAKRALMAPPFERQDDVEPPPTPSGEVVEGGDS